MNHALRNELLEMLKADQEMRSGEWNHEVDKRNTTRLKQVVEAHGWPTISLVGTDGAHAAWLIAQHADHDTAFQVHALELITDAVKKGEVTKSNLAYLTDRVCMHAGKPQVFGTQFYVDKEGVFGPRPIEDFETLDERRKAHDLESFEEYEKQMHKSYKAFKERQTSAE